MQGDPKVLEALNLALKIELTAVNQFVLHARMLDYWGYAKRGKHEMAESIEEMKHLDMLIQRILLLDGLPNLQDVGKLYIGQNLKETIEGDLRLEREAMEHYRQTIPICEKARDFVSRDLTIKLLDEEEKHEDALSTDLALIEEIGIQNFAQSQMGEPGERAG
jgi:bacterioferritin